MSQAHTLTDPNTRPEPGEQTRDQGAGHIGGYLPNLPGYAAPLPGTYTTYRLMRGNPTLAIARVAATAPIRSADWSLQADDNAPTHWLDFIRQQVQQLRPILVSEALRALDYGWQPFEKVYAHQHGRMVIRKLKPLRPELTTICIDPLTGSFAGLKQDDIKLAPEKCFVYIHDAEAGEWYGRSRHENVRQQAWSPWMDLLEKQGQYVNKAAGVIPMIEYPQGVSLDRSGQQRDNYELAEAVARQLGNGQGVTMPNTLARYAEDIVRTGMDPAQLRAWRISFLETRAGHGSEFIAMMRHFESLMLRGWLVPERAVTEGRGTQADAAEHADLALQVAQEVLDDLVRHVNWHLIDPLLVLNFGPDARGKVQIKPAPLADDKVTFLRQVVQRVLASPGSMDLLSDMLDLDAMLDQAGLPRHPHASRPS